ncbi:hypothetical protein FEM03_01535 [Phragmitibacter flavus]|uniref:peptidoglycan glycosyltransferase n=1 Tax=Phragmitibacter flavus TaxID=2576071 RepID=A0A5R8KKL0_9BACT|nr:transglycosylase domain-containing protein [Phragmitibacter flavus]TLD72780.1 hypothetical protein FEM03_01535 [Phragmitibacter flavus]
MSKTLKASWKILRRHWLKTLLISALTLFVAGLVAGLWIWRTFSLAAAEVDLTELDKVKEGTHVEDRHGEPVGILFADNRRFVTLNQVPKDVIDALIATEDARFYQHGGFDYQGISRAMVRNVSRMSIRQGGSTITQQLARQAFNLKGRTFRRKLLETFVACRIEQNYSKSDILEYYLNQIYLGNGFYGIGSGARGYFGKEIGDLTLEEGALLVGIIKAPVSFSPFKNMEAAKRARNLTLQRMLVLHPTESKRIERAIKQPVRVVPEESRVERPDYLLAAAERHLENLKKEGETGPWKKVSLSVDARLQSQLDNKVSTYVTRIEKELTDAEPGKSALQAAVVVIDNKTGAIVATCGGRDFKTSPFDRALLGHRPVGTAFLPLSYAAMLTVKPELDSMLVLDAPLDNRRAMIGGERGVLGEWGGETDQPVHEGFVPVLHSLAKGKTGAAVRVAQDIGLERTREILLRCGFETPLSEYSSVVLGSGALRLIDVARAFAAVANDGVLSTNHSLVTQTHSYHGVREMRAEETGRHRVFNPSAAEQVRNVLVSAMKDPEKLEVLRAHRIDNGGLAGWGGTAYGSSDAWFIGFDKNITCAVWIGYDETRSMGKGVWAKRVALPLWAEVMAAATQGRPEGWLSTPAIANQGLPSFADGSSGREVIPMIKATSLAEAGAAKLVAPQSPVLMGEDPYQPRPTAP